MKKFIVMAILLVFVSSPAWAPSPHTFPAWQAYSDGVSPFNPTNKVAVGQTPGGSGGVVINADGTVLAAGTVTAGAFSPSSSGTTYSAGNGLARTDTEFRIIDCADGESIISSGGSAYICTVIEGIADNLGNHTATQALDMGAYGITDTGPITGATTGSFSSTATLAGAVSMPAVCGTVGWTFVQGASELSCVELTGGAETNTLETVITGIESGEIFYGTGSNAGAFTAHSFSKIADSISNAQVPTDITVDLATAASALNANPTNCAAGSYARGIAADGTAEDCTAAGSGTTYSAGNGLNLAGTEFAAVASTHITVNANGISVDDSPSFGGTVTAPNFVASASTHALNVNNSTAPTGTFLSVGDIYTLNGAPFVTVDGTVKSAFYTEESLIFGTNLTLTGNTLDATGGGSSLIAGTNISVDGSTVSVIDNPVFADRVKATGFSTSALDGNLFIDPGNTNDYSGTQQGAIWFNQTDETIRYNDTSSTSQTVASKAWHTANDSGSGSIAGTNINITGSTISVNINSTFSLNNNYLTDGAQIQGVSFTANGTTTQAGFIHLKEQGQNGTDGINVYAPDDVTSTVNTVFPNAGGTLALTSDISAHAASTSVHHAPVAALAFGAITGSISDAQVPDDITVTAATISGTITSAQIAADIARDSELFGGSFSDLAGSITDAQLIYLENISNGGTTASWVLATDGVGDSYWKEDATGGGGANLFDEFIADSGTNPTAGDTNDELTIAGGTGIATVGSATDDTITISTVDSEIVHDNLSGFVETEHLDWSVTQTPNIHTDNYTDTNTTYSAGNGLALTATEFSANAASIDHDGLLNFDAAEHFLQSAITEVGTVTTGNVTSVVDAATLTAAGKVELATTTETLTGTDATRAVTPDGLQAHADSISVHHAKTTSLPFTSITGAAVDGQIPVLEDLNNGAAAGSSTWVLATDGAGDTYWKADANSGGSTALDAIGDPSSSSTVNIAGYSWGLNTTNGNIQFDGTDGITTTFTNKYINVGMSSATTHTADGDTYYNTTDNEWKVHDGTQFRVLYTANGSTAVSSADIAADMARDSELHAQSHDNTDHTTNYAVAGGAEHDGFSDFVGAEHLTPGDGLTQNGTAVDVDANIRAASHAAQLMTPADADNQVWLFKAQGAGLVTEIECYATGGGTTINVYKNSAVDISGATFTCTSGTWVSDTTLTNTAIADNDSFYVDIIAANGASKIFVQINYTE